MKAIMISVRPQQVEKILNGIKKDEVCKGTALYKAINKLIEEQGVAPMFIYCTKDRKQKLCYVPATETFYCYSKDNIVAKQCDRMGLTFNGKVVARFNATAEEINATNLEKFAKDSCLTIRELEEYLWSNILSGTAIRINDLEIFDEPKEISEFYKVGYYKAAEEVYRDNLDEGYDKNRAWIKAERSLYAEFVLTHAPRNGWCYVEV